MNGNNLHSNVKQPIVYQVESTNGIIASDLRYVRSSQN